MSRPLNAPHLSPDPVLLLADRQPIPASTPIPARSPSRQGAVTFRALFAGAVVCVLLGAAAPYENLIISGSPLHFDYSTPAAVFLFLLFLLLANPLLALLRHSWRFTSAELATVYIMAAVACTIPTGGLVCHLLPHISSGTYFSTPENGWAEEIVPFLPAWMRVSDPQAVKWFYEGLPSGTSLPWMAWLAPLLGWLPMLLAAYAAMTALMVLVRRQWIQHERLTFPLVQVPISMIGEDGEGRGAASAFFRTPAVWIGILIPLLQYSLRALHNYYPVVPEGVPIWKYYYFWDGNFQLRWSISHAVVGFGFLLSTKLGFSMWFLGLLTTLERAVLLHYGVPGTQRVEGIALGSAYLAYQGFGALAVLAASSLWVARGHLRRIWRTIVQGPGEGEGDDGEILSYRQAVGLLAASVLVMWLWLHAAGLAWWLAPLLIGTALGVMFGLARIVAEGGLAVTKAPLVPADALIGAFGASALGHANLGALGMTFAWAGGMRVTLMAAVIHGLRLAEHYITRHRRRLAAAVLLAVLCAAGASAVTVLALGYRHGALNLSFWFFGERAATLPYTFTAYHLANQARFTWEFLGVTGAGGAVQLALTLASKRFLWFPVHPIAFPISAMWTTHHLMPSIFIGWLVKTSVLRYGGVTLYRRVRPFFLGLILGHYAAGGLWCVIDGITGMTGNYLFFW